MRSILLAAGLLASTASAQLCVGQGQGSCQGTYFCASNAGCNFWIYDYACNLIGYAVNPQAGQAIDSQLPYTVDIDIVLYSDGSSNVLATFDYAGGRYGWGNTNFVQGDCTTEEGSTCHYMRAAFPC